jgi:chromosome segregation ATPase
MKTAGMNVAHVIKLLGMVNNDMQSIEHRCQELRREAASLEASNRNAARTLEQLSFTISETQKTLDHYESLSKQQRSEMDKLFHQKTQLEEFVEFFKNGNTKYVKIKENIKHEFEDTLANPKNFYGWLLYL